MIRCENCGHKLMDGQKVCDICKKPVISDSIEDLELERQLAKSIAQIVESETADAKAYYRSDAKKDVLGVSQRSSSSVGNGSAPARNRRDDVKSNIQNRNVGGARPASAVRQGNASRTSSASRTDGTGRSNSANRYPGENRPVNRPVQNKANAGGNSNNNRNYVRHSQNTKSNKTSGNGGKIALIIFTCIFTMALLVGLAFITINTVISKAKNNFAYYNNTGVEYYQKNDYANAIPYLEKALSFEEAKDRINIRFTLFDCYKATNDTEKAVTILYSILQIEPYNLEAIVNLEKYFEAANVTEALKELYEKYKDTQAASVVAKYYIENPKISLPGGDYNYDVELILTTQYPFAIYYTLDGTEPTTSSNRYTNSIKIKEGKTVVKFFAVNEYGICSDILTETYNVTYTAPAKATINPASGSYQTEQLIVIGNIPAGGSAYYTLDNTTPDMNSILYEGPFDMPEGNTILSVIVYDKNGLKSSITRRNYVLEKTERISKDEALEFIWDTMMQKEMVNEEHKSSDNYDVELIFDAKRLIEGNYVWTYHIVVKKPGGDEYLNYQMGVGCETGYVYTVYENNGIYKLDAINY